MSAVNVLCLINTKALLRGPAAISQEAPTEHLIDPEGLYSHTIGQTLSL
jgi:hypothetical protein